VIAHALRLAWLVLLCTIFSVCGFAGRVSAQLPGKLDSRPVQVTWADGAAKLTFSAKDFADANVQKKLQNGLPQTLVVRLYAFRDRSPEPFAASAVTCRVVYDLWEGGYRIERQTEQTDKTLSAKSVDGVIQQCLQGQSLRFADASVFDKQRGRSIYFAALVELNPLSQDTVQRIRRWLARPSGNQLEGNAFFGSFVSIFVSRNMGSAEKSMAFRCESLIVPTATAPP
jgi:hypothetical protein